MAERERKTWRELCRAALEAKDDFREATRASKSYADTNMSRISRYSRLETDDNL
jgi:hypothetical protein